MTEQPSWWDPYSNQPYQLRPEDKPRTTWPNVSEYLKTGGTALFKFPGVAWQYVTTRPLHNDVPFNEFAGLGVSPDPRHSYELQDMVSELGVRHLLTRVPSWDVGSLDEIYEFIHSFEGCDWLINVLQCRETVRDLESWERVLDIVFDKLGPVTPYFQIGNAINRTKWGCDHSGDYLRLLESAEKVRSRYPEVNLVGSSVIDFEPLVTMRTLWNARRYTLDVVSSLLYVNRRGSPYRRQYFLFNLKEKLRLLHAITSRGNRNARRFWITETNWPLLNTKPYTPNSGKPGRTVDEGTQAEYLRQYFHVAFESGWVERVYWWQLINPGYGLVDHRSGVLRRMPAYYAFKDLLAETEN